MAEVGLPQRLKVLRESKSLTQRDLASMLNVSPATIALYETSNRRPDPDMLGRLADFFGVSVDYLLGRTNQRNPSPAGDSLSIQSAGYPLRELIDAAQALPPEAQEELRKYAQYLQVRETLKGPDKESSATSAEFG